MNPRRTTIAATIAALGLTLAACSSPARPVHHASVSTTTAPVPPPTTTTTVPAPVAPPPVPTTTTTTTAPPIPSPVVAPPTLQATITASVALIPAQWVAPGWTWVVVPVLPAPYQADDALTGSACNCTQFSASALATADSTVVQAIVDHEAENAIVFEHVPELTNWSSVPGWPSVFQAEAPIAPGFSVVDEASRCLTQYALGFDPPANGVDESDSIECPASLGDWLVNQIAA